MPYAYRRNRRRLSSKPHGHVCATCLFALQPPPTSRHRTPTPITSARPVDASSRIHNPSQAEDTSYGSVPFYQPSHTSRCRNTTPTTPLSTVDVSKRIHNPPAGSYEPMCQHSTHYDAPGVDCHQNPKATSIRRVPPLVQPPLTSGCRTPTPMTSTPPVDAFSRVHNTTGPHDPTHRVPTGIDAPMSIETNHNPLHGYHNTIR